MCVTLKILPKVTYDVGELAVLQALCFLLVTFLHEYLRRSQECLYYCSDLHLKYM